MDQDAFRNLLGSSLPSQAHTKPATNKIAATSITSDPTFKPRKVKKAESRYRDRAAERRGGIRNDYAQVEAVLEDFQKRVADEDKDVIEQQRKYLGGDSQHTVLVKGLDTSLLEQHRARTSVSAEDDDTLEHAFTEATSTEPKKRTREDIIRNLKAKRQNRHNSPDPPVVQKSVEDWPVFEEAWKAGKFRPIGFKPTGRSKEILKKRKNKEGKEGVKKKQKIEPVSTQSQDRPAEETPLTSQEHRTMEAPKKLLEPEPLDENFDIFAGAGDYEGFLGDETDGEHSDTEEARDDDIPSVPAAGGKGWFDEPKSEPEPEDGRAPIQPEKSPVSEAKELVHLQPLESSALPSIRDFLAMDEAVEKAEKRKARKEKKKKKKKDVGDDD